MKAIMIDKAGGPEELQLKTNPLPDYGPDDVLVQMQAIGVNFIDIYLRTGLYAPPHYPYIPGKEGSGVITAIGTNVKDLKPGDRVAFCSAGSGTYAENVAIPAAEVVLIPEAISFDIAAAAMLQGLTAYYLSHLTFLLSQNHIALIHAGAGGVGTLLIQMAKIMGAKVITTVSTEEKAKIARDAGADVVVNYMQESFLQCVMDYTQSMGANVVYDAVGKTTFDDSLKSLAVRGMLVTYGQASGPIAPFNLKRLSEKSLYITRPKLNDYTRNKLELNKLASILFDLILHKKIKITIGQRYSLADAAKAHADLENRKTIGKSILVIS